MTCVRWRAKRAARLTRDSSISPESKTCCQSSSRRATPFAVGSAATKAPLTAPMLVPTTRSGVMSAASRACSMPTWLAPRAPPPPRTKATVDMRPRLLCRQVPPDDIHPDVERAAGAVGEDHALERGDVPEVAPPPGDDVARVGEVVVRRVQVDPVPLRRHRRDPRVRGVGAGELRLARRWGGLDVPRDIAAGQTYGAQAAQREVGEVLADTRPLLQQLGEG